MGRQDLPEMCICTNSTGGRPGRSCHRLQTLNVKQKDKRQVGNTLHFECTQRMTEPVGPLFPCVSLRRPVVALIFSGTLWFSFSTFQTMFLSSRFVHVSDARQFLTDFAKLCGRRVFLDCSANVCALTQKS